MKTLILYASKYGATADCAKRIASQLANAEIKDIAKDPRPNLSGYDTVVLGTSVYMGRPRKEMTAYCKYARDLLLDKRLGLFLCCIQDLNKGVAQQFDVAFPKALRDHACVLGALGGRVDYRKLNRVDGFIMRMIAGDLHKRSGSDVLETLSQERVERFVELLKEGN